MAKDLTAKLAELAYDGDTVEIGKGRTLRLRIEPDDLYPFEDADCYGMISPVEQDRYSPYHNERNRPDNFNGNAEKIDIPNNGGTVWWQPPADGPKRGTPAFERERQGVLNLLEFGYCGFILELRKGTDGYGHPIVRKSASLWGIEPFPPAETSQEIIRNLWAELSAQK